MLICCNKTQAQSQSGRQDLYGRWTHVNSCERYLTYIVLSSFSLWRSQTAAVMRMECWFADSSVCVRLGKAAISTIFSLLLSPNKYIRQCYCSPDCQGGIKNNFNKTGKWMDAATTPGWPHGGAEGAPVIRVARRVWGGNFLSGDSNKCLFRFRGTLTARPAATYVWMCGGAPSGASRLTLMSKLTSLEKYPKCRFGVCRKPFMCHLHVNFTGFFLRHVVGFHVRLIRPNLFDLLASFPKVFLANGI